MPTSYIKTAHSSYKSTYPICNHWIPFTDKHFSTLTTLSKIPGQFSNNTFQDVFIHFAQQSSSIHTIYLLCLYACVYIGIYIYIMFACMYVYMYIYIYLTIHRTVHSPILSAHLNITHFVLSC